MRLVVRGSRAMQCSNQCSIEKMNAISAKYYPSLESVTSPSVMCFNKESQKYLHVGDGRNIFMCVENRSLIQHFLLQYPISHEPCLLHIKRLITFAICQETEV